MKLIDQFKIFLITGFALSLCGADCNKNKGGLVYTGTIFYMGCYNVGLDVDGATGTGGGIKWKDHTNAVAIGNRCYLLNKNVKAGSTITFKISDTNIEPGTNCPVTDCTPDLDVPSSKIFIYDIKLTN